MPTYSTFFTKLPCGSYFAQINVNPNGPCVYHAIDIHVKQHWFQDLSPTSTVALITDNSADILEVHQSDVIEAIAQGSMLKLFHLLLGFSDFTLSYILWIFPRISRNTTCASAHHLAQKLVHKRVTRSSYREFSSFRSGHWNISDLQ